MLDDACPTPAAAELERARRDALCPSERADAISYDWAGIGIGIVLAGGAYPLVLAAIFMSMGAAAFAWGTLSGYQNGPRLSDGIEVVVALTIYSFIAGMAGMLWSGCVTVLTLPIIYLFAWSLHLQASIVRIGAFAGGLVGFICVLPLTLSVPWFNFGGDVWQIFFMMTLGPMLTTILGQLGGAWGGSKSREMGPNHDRPTIINLPRLPCAPPVDAGESLEPARPRLQFGIRHLLWISVWLSLLLALVRVSGIPFELMLPLLLGWIVFQSATMWIGGQLLPRLSQWRAQRRQFRST